MFTTLKKKGETPPFFNFLMKFNEHIEKCLFIEPSSMNFHALDILVKPDQETMDLTEAMV